MKSLQLKQQGIRTQEELEHHSKINVKRQPKETKYREVIQCPVFEKYVPKYRKSPEIPSRTKSEESIRDKIQETLEEFAPNLRKIKNMKKLARPQSCKCKNCNGK